MRHHGTMSVRDRAQSPNRTSVLIPVSASPGGTRLLLRYSFTMEKSMNWKLKSALAVSALLLAAQAAAQVTFYENESYGGRSFTTDREVGDLNRFGFNNRASSLVVNQGRWEVCENAGYAGKRYHSCLVLTANVKKIKTTPIQDKIKRCDSLRRPFQD